MDSNTQQKGRGQNKHFWTTEEDEALIESLIKLSKDSRWRVKNEFRGGFLNQLERMIKKKIPQTKLKAIPNIESRVKLMRKKTIIIKKILSEDGFDWNYENHSIRCERRIYDDYVKTHKEAAGLYGKSFSFYNNDLAKIFNDHRALDNNRGDIGDDATQEVNITTEEDVGLSHIDYDEFFNPTQELNESPSPTSSDSSASKTSTHRKRKRYDRDRMMEQTLENFRSFVDMVGPELKTLSKAATSMVEIATRNEAARAKIEEKKRSLNEVLFSIGLTDVESIFMLQVLAKDEDQLKVFCDLRNDKNLQLQFCRVFLKRMSYCLPSA